MHRPPSGPPPAQRRAESESHHREKARYNRDLPNTGQREAKENHVARHVGHEHMPQAQVTERVHKASHHRQANQELRIPRFIGGSIRGFQH